MVAIDALSVRATMATRLRLVSIQVIVEIAAAFAKVMDADRFDA